MLRVRIVMYNSAPLLKALGHCFKKKLILSRRRVMMVKTLISQSSLHKEKSHQKTHKLRGWSVSKIAVLVITEATEINQVNLRVVESHLVYSLNKENAAVRFFIVKCTKSFSEDITPISIRYIVDSLQGPLVKKDCISWSVTEAVAYFHMFPYTAIMSAWLSRDATSDEVQNTVSMSGVLNADKSPMPRDPSKTPAADESDGPASASSSAVHAGAKVNTNNVFQKESRFSRKNSMHNTTMVSDNMDHSDFIESTNEKKNAPDINSAKQPQAGDTFGTSREKNVNGLQS